MGNRQVEAAIAALQGGGRGLSPLQRLLAQRLFSGLPDKPSSEESQNSYSLQAGLARGVLRHLVKMYDDAGAACRRVLDGTVREGGLHLRWRVQRWQRDWMRALHGLALAAGPRRLARRRQLAVALRPSLAFLSPALAAERWCDEAEEELLADYTRRRDSGR